VEALPDSGSADPRIIVLMHEIANQLDSILAQAAKPLASTASRRSASLGTRAVHRGFLRQRHQDEQQRGEPNTRDRPWSPLPWRITWPSNTQSAEPEETPGGWAAGGDDQGPPGQRPNFPRPVWRPL